MEFAEFINGKILRVHDIETACKNFTDEIVAIVKQVQGENNRLRAENEQLKNEHYKDAEIQRLVAENEAMKKRVSGCFELSDSERKEIYAWQSRHISQRHHGRKNAGAIGGRFKYIFTPTSIGEIGEIECSCGDSFCFRELT